jgi:4-diphosphocytidyl-2-C-methyl-D-erythritol kinase
MPAWLAPAKINLSLEILGKRPDGFHELASVMQEVTLCDELTVTPAGDLSLEVDVDCGPAEQNLALRAARLLQRWAAVEPGASIALRKRIPAGAGLGGGSSDAATALIALNRLWRTDCDCEALAQLAVTLGSDVPFFLTGGTAMVTGRGERVLPLPFPGTSWYVLTSPGFHVSTATVFSALPHTEWSSGWQTREVANCLAAGETPPAGINGLTQTLFRLYPEAELCFRAAESAVPGRTWVSGSGPTVVSQCNGPEAAQRAADDLRRLGYTTFVVRNYPTEDRELPCRD